MSSAATVQVAELQPEVVAAVDAQILEQSIAEAKRPETQLYTHKTNIALEPRSWLLTVFARTWSPLRTPPSRPAREEANWQPAVQYHQWLFERLPVVGGIDVELSV